MLRALRAALTHPPNNALHGSYPTAAFACKRELCVYLELAPRVGTDPAQRSNIARTARYASVSHRSPRPALATEDPDSGKEPLQAIPCVDT